MKINIEELHPDTFYHVYNRGINGEQIFKRTENYRYFLQLYAEYIEPIAMTYAYVLMGNHFHFLMKTKSETEIKTFYNNLWKDDPRFIGTNGMPIKQLKDRTAEYIISKQFSHFFNSYAQAINNQEKRTGGLFEKPFRRIPIYNMAYAKHTVYYIHFNPQKHGFVDDFRDYPHSSYHSFISDFPTKLPRQKVMNWFGGLQDFLAYHGVEHDLEADWETQHWIEIKQEEEEESDNEEKNKI
jgi:putative transposase